MLYIRYTFFLIIMLSIVACSNSGEDTENDADPKYSLEYKGLYFYKENIPSSQYTLTQLSDSEFNDLNISQQLQVADKLLGTMFYGHTQPLLEEKILGGEFLAQTKSSLETQTTDIATLEAELINTEHFRQETDSSREISNILSRLYLMEDLDSYYYKNWMAYILTQTIMFSPANELESIRIPNVARVYNRIVTLLDDEAGMRYLTYMHMISEDNWRRFRSPEDNGREMLEIFALDEDDSSVLIAGKALQNWRLDNDGNTLVIGLNENTEVLNLFDTEIVNGDDFYRELVKSDEYTFGLIKRIVDFLFIDSAEEKKTEIINSLVSSNPESFQDIFTQILFSKEYLLHTSRAKSVEELFFSLSKKMSFKHYRNSFYNMVNSLDDMHQASMKYKLGKTERVPLDTLSFATYHKFIREQILVRRSNNAYDEDYTSSNRQGWSDTFIAYDNFNYDETLRDESVSLDSFIKYLFNTLLLRDPTQEELDMFNEHMFSEVNGEETFVYYYDMFVSDSNDTVQIQQRESRKGTIALLVLDYISRIDALYIYSEVE